MRKTLRALIVRGAAAAAAGIVVEVLNTVVKPKAEHGNAAAGDVAEHARDAEEWVQAVTKRAAQWAHDADVSERVREISRRILSSEFADKTGTTASRIIDVTNDKAHSLLHRSE